MKVGLCGEGCSKLLVPRQALPADSRMSDKVMLLVLLVTSAQHKLVMGLAEVAVHKQLMHGVSWQSSMVILSAGCARRLL